MEGGLPLPQDLAVGVVAHPRGARLAGGRLRLGLRRQGQQEDRQGR
jgi:hypothetical protein